VSRYLVIKGQEFEQTNATARLTRTNNLPFRFVASADASAPGNILAAGLKLPNAQTRGLTSDAAGNFDFEQGFGSKSLLDASYAAGSYVWSFNTLNDGAVTATSVLAADNYPGVPNISNFAELQAIAASQPTDIFWSGFTNGTANDFVRVEIDGLDGTELFSTAPLLDPLALAATNVTVQIPAATLADGMSYLGKLLFVKRTADSGADSAAGYYRQTTFPLVTLPAPGARIQSGVQGGKAKAVAGSVQFTVRSNTVAEAGHTVTLTVARTGGTTGSVSVDFATADGTAIDGQNYTATNGTLVFSNGVASKSIAVAIINDTLFEANEAFTVTLSNPQGGVVLGTNQTVKVSIINDDFPGTFALKQNAYTVNENAGSVTVNVIRTGGNASGVTVDLSTQEGTALDGVRYTGYGNTLTFAGGETNKAVSIGIINDTIPNGNQSFSVLLANATGGAKVSTNALQKMATITVLDDESSVAFSNATYTVSEAVGTLTATVIRTGALITQVGVDYNTADGSAVAGRDYRFASGTLVFPPNVKSKTFSVSITNNTIVDGTRTFSLQLSNPTNGVQLGAQSIANVSITDNDLGGVVKFNALTNSVPDTATNAFITLTRSGGAASGASVDFSTADDTAHDGSDYTGIFRTITFNANETSKTVSIPITKKTQIDQNRSLFLFLQNAQGGATITNGSATAVLNITESRSSIGLAADLYSANKTDSNVVVTLVRGGALNTTVSVGYTTVNGTALNPADYRTAAGTASFGPGVTSKNILIPIVNNHARSGDTTLSFRITTPVGSILAAPTNATINIIDPSVSANSIFNFSAPVYSANKTNGNAVVTVTRIGGLANAVSVDVGTDDGTAKILANDEYAGAFYDPTGEGDYLSTGTTVSFAPGVSSANVPIPVLNNPLGGIRPNDGGTNRWFTCSLSNPQGPGSQLGSTATARVDILDTLKHGTVAFSARSYTNSAAGGNAAITINRTGGSDGTVLIYFAIVPGTAQPQSPADYDVNASGFYVFSPGETSKVVNVPLFVNNATAYPKTATLVLNTPYFGDTVGAVSNVVLRITP
jgi:hypothetical protein